MNNLQIREINRRAMLESKAEINEDKIIYAIANLKMNLAQTTKNERVVDTMVNCHGFHIVGMWKNGNQI